MPPTTTNPRQPPPSQKDWGGVTLSMHPNQIVVSPRLPEADALANWWTPHANDAFNRLSASVPVAVNPVMQETISNAILAYRAANAHLSNDDINAGVIELVKSFHH